MLAGQCASNITHEPVAKRGAAGSARPPSTTPGAFGGTGTVRPGEESGFKIAGAGSGAIVARRRARLPRAPLWAHGCSKFPFCGRSRDHGNLGYFTRLGVVTAPPTKPLQPGTPQVA